MEVTIRQEEVRITTQEGEQKQKSIVFNFDPDKVEMVRAKDGAYIIRERRNRSAATFPKEEGS